jgi:hypothetical protein
VSTVQSRGRGPDRRGRLADTLDVVDCTTVGRRVLLLAATFTICFVTGLISHGVQHPPGWFDWQSRPVKSNAPASPRWSPRPSSSW